VPDDGYLPALRRICDAKGWLLMLDEVQTGNGRTGRYFAYQHLGILPDVVTTAKGLANGLPIGACLARGVAAQTLKAGNHGSTFGGNPLACAAAHAVIDALVDDGLIERAAALGERMLDGFRKALAGDNRVVDIRGKGLMLGIELNAPAPNLVKAALATGLLINVTHDSVIRLLPPLILTDSQADEIVARVSALIKDPASGPS
jgi:acetylornithine aminotransferase